MKRIAAMTLCLMLLTACDGAGSAVSEYVVVPRENQNEAIEANNALLEAYDWDGDPDTVDVMPKDYAGRYIDQDNVLTILTVAPLRDVLETYQEACGTKNIRLEQAEFSYYDLNQAMEALTTYNETHDPPLCYAWGINDSTNRLEITVSTNMEEEAQKLREQHPCISYTLERVEPELADHREYLTDDCISIQMDVDSLPLDSRDVAYRIENNSKMEMFYTNTLMLDILKDDAWYTIPYRSDIAFPDSLPVIMPGGTGEASEWLQARNFEFTPGTYRLGLLYCLGEYAPARGKDFDHIAYVTFELTE